MLHERSWVFVDWNNEMDAEDVTLLQKSADIIQAEVGNISPEAVAAFLFILSKEKTTIEQVATYLNLSSALAARIAIELSTHQGGVGLIDVAIDGDMHRVISVNEKSIQFAGRLGYNLRN